MVTMQLSDIIILVQADLSLEKDHNTSTLVENILKEKDDVYDVHVLVESNIIHFKNQTKKINYHCI